MVGAVTVLARAVRVVSRGARGLERNPDEFRRPQRSTKSGAGMQQAGGAAAGPVGPGLGPGSGRARAGLGPGQSQGFSVLLSFGPSLTVTKFLHL